MAARLAVSRAISYHTAAERVTFNRRLSGHGDGRRTWRAPSRPQTLQKRQFGDVCPAKCSPTALLPGTLALAGTALEELKSRQL
jgi:hypothetical protein